MVGERTMIPRTIPLCAVIRHPGMSKVVETSMGGRKVKIVKRLKS